MNSWWQAGQLAAQHAQAQQAQQAWYPKQGQKQAKRGGKPSTEAVVEVDRALCRESSAGSKCQPPLQAPRIPFAPHRLQ